MVFSGWGFSLWKAKVKFLAKKSPDFLVTTLIFLFVLRGNRLPSIRNTNKIILFLVRIMLFALKKIKKMLKRISKLSFLFVVAIALAFVSCEKEGIDELSDNFITSNAEVRTSGDEMEASGESSFVRQRGNRGGCFELVYPVTISFSDGSTVEVNSREEAREAKRVFKTANPDAEGRPTLVFPIQITQDDMTVDIADAEALEAVKEACPRGGRGGGKKGGKGNRGKCFQPVFPVTLSFPDGTSQEVADKDAAKEAVMTWKEANPDAEDRPSIAFPYDVLLKDSTTMTLTSEEDLDALKETCKGSRGDRGGRGESCFEINYPVSITINGGEAIAINERSEIRDALRAWKEANADATERPEVALVFPITVTLEDETTSTLNSQEELDALKESCPQEGGRGGRGSRNGRGGRG